MFKKYKLNNSLYLVYRIKINLTIIASFLNFALARLNGYIKTSLLITVLTNYLFEIEKMVRYVCYTRTHNKRL